jgi:transposase-like protein
MARPPDARKQQCWLDVMQRWQRSQLTVRAFCDRHGLSEASFYLWRRVLRERGLLSQHPPLHHQPHPAGAATFVKLTVAAPATDSATLEVVLNQHRLLRVRPGFDPDTLRQLVRLLEEPAC